MEFKGSFLPCGLLRVQPTCSPQWFDLAVVEGASVSLFGFGVAVLHTCDVISGFYSFEEGKFLNKSAEYVSVASSLAVVWLSLRLGRVVRFARE